MTDTRSEHLSLLARLERLPPFPAAALRLIEAASDDEAEVRQIAGLIAQDPALVAEVLREANRAHYPRVAAITCLDEAVMALGLRGLATYAMTALCGRFLLERVPHPEIAKTVWCHSLAVGALARELAPRSKGSGAVAGTLGILHEIGRLALLRVAPDILHQVNQAVEQGVPVGEAERRMLEVRISALSAAAAKVLRLPPSLCALMYSLDGLDPAPPPEVRAVLAADHLAPLLGYPVYRNALGVPLDPTLEESLKLGPRELRRLAVMAANASGHREGQSPVAVVSEAAESDRAFEALLRANRRLAELNSDYERTRRELERRAKDTQSLVATFASLTMGLDEDALRYSILESLLEHYRVDWSFIAHGESGQGLMSGKAFHLDPKTGPQVLAIRMDLSRFDRETREAMLQGEALTIRSGVTARILREQIGEFAYLCVAPLMTRGSCCGILGIAVGSGQEDSAGEGEFLNILATAAALGLENARLYADVLQEATVDPLTSVATRRVVMDELEDLGLTPPSARHPFAVLLVDLDHFKAVNDTLGHQAGDRYLRDMASAIRETIRGKDRVGRYGGDEFVVILRDVSLEEALQIAQQALERMQETARSPRWSPVPGPLGATVGVTWWDGGPLDSSTLVAMADSSLYVGKAAGRNRVGSPAIREVVPQT